ATAAKVSTFFIALLLCHILLRFEFECQLFDLAGEFGRRIVAIFDQRDAGPGVLANVKGLVLRERDWRGVLYGISGHFLAIHGEHAGAAFTKTRSVGLEVEDDGVLAGCQLGPLPCRALEIEKVAETTLLAAADQKSPFGEEQAIAAETPALGDNHALCAAVRDLDRGSDGVGFVLDVRSSGARDTSRRTRRPSDPP